MDTATYNKSSKTISVSVTENTGESKRDGTIIVTGKSNGNETVKTLTLTQAGASKKNFIEVKKIGFKTYSYEEKLGVYSWTTAGSREAAYTFTDFNSSRSGDYQVITASYHKNEYDVNTEGSQNEDFSLTIKLDKDLNIEGDFSINRKTRAHAGTGEGVWSDDYQTFSGTFSEPADKTYYSYKILLYEEQPKTFSYNHTGLQAYFPDTNTIHEYSFSTSSTNACLSIQIDFK